MLVESSGIFSNFGAESPPLLQAATRLPTIIKKTLHILTILLLPLTVLGQSDYWARLSISGGVSELGISPSEEIWVATKAGNVYYTKQIRELWHIGPFGSLDPYNFSTGKTFERVNFFSEDTLMISGFIQESGNFTDKLSDKFKTKGLLGAFLLGALFALAFCLYSGALFFAMLMPMMLSESAGLALPVVFSLGTGLPVILCAFVIAYSMEKLGMYFKSITKIEKVMRFATGLVFILTGFYYLNIYFKII